MRCCFLVRTPLFVAVFVCFVVPIVLVIVLLLPLQLLLVRVDTVTSVVSGGGGSCFCSGLSRYNVHK